MNYFATVKLVMKITTRIFSILLSIMIIGLYCRVESFRIQRFARAMKPSKSMELQTPSVSALFDLNNGVMDRINEIKQIYSNLEDKVTKNDENNKEQMQKRDAMLTVILSADALEKTTDHLSMLADTLHSNLTSPVMMEKAEKFHADLLDCKHKLEAELNSIMDADYKHYFQVELEQKES